MGPNYVTVFFLGVAFGAKLVNIVSALVDMWEEKSNAPKAKKTMQATGEQPSQQGNYNRNSGNHI